MKNKLITALVLAGCIVLAGAESGLPVQLLNAGRLLGEQKYTQALEAYRQLLQDPALPPWMRNEVLAGLSCASFGLGESEAGLTHFAQAVEAGFNNYIAIHQIPVLRTYFDHPEFRRIYASMRISPADLQELHWLYAEIRSISHDTNMMITENTGRADDDWTVVLQSAIPARTPQSPAILVMREVLRHFQTQQRSLVQQSDQSRMSHNMQRRIIQNYPGGGNTPAHSSNPYSREKIEESRRQAVRRAENRQLAITRRHFSLPPGTSTAPEPCPAPGSIKTP